MSKIIEHTYNGFKWLLVEVPEDGTSFIIYQGNQLSYEHSVTGSETGSRTGFIGEELLPSGSWEIVGKADSMTEEQWKEIVESGVCNDSGDHGLGFFRYYREYPDELEESFGFFSAKESGEALLLSHGLKPETTLILKS